MIESRIIWIASYPRSGNTFLRTILWHCFGFRSASVYANDLGGRKELENYVGHVERGQDGNIQFPLGAVPLIKTHELPADDKPAIYVVRDGRAVSASMYEFYRGKISMEDVIEGRHRFGTWSAHLDAWKPWERRDTLLIKYEDIVGDLSSVLERMSAFLRCGIMRCQIPDRETIASADGRWVRNKSDWTSKLSEEQVHLFNRINEGMMRKMGYLD